jgi:hypothetical protein
MESFVVIFSPSVVHFYKQYIWGCVTQVERHQIINNNLNNEIEKLYNLPQLEDNYDYEK